MHLFLVIGGIAGGIGIFLLAMKLITDGLKLAAGDALRAMISRSTATRTRGLLLGVVVTAIVQSSSAVTIAMIGFVNAGLMSLLAAIGVIYGANVGTTMTAWLVAALGFKVKVELFALPMIGVGMPLWFIRPATRRGGLGQAIAGFGLFFIGIQTLTASFELLAPSVDFAVIAAYGWLGAVLLVGIGFLLTLLTQSSSAAIAIILTATTGGVIALPSAAAMVIGANVGTTSTALFAALHATPNAKRVAAAHILFNIVTGAAALLILPLLVWAATRSGQMLGLEETPAVVLAMFHTAFNLLGVVILWPFTRRLVHWLAGRFRTREEDEGNPEYLDSAVAGTPVLAIEALQLEVTRLGGLVRALTLDALTKGRAAARFVVSRQGAIDRLVAAIGEFVASVEKGALDEDVAGLLPSYVRVSQYYLEAAELAASLIDLPEMILRLGGGDSRAAADRFLGSVRLWFAEADPSAPEFSVAGCESSFDALETAYHQLKDHLIQAGVHRRIPILPLSQLLEHLSTLNRLLKRHLKAVRMLADLDEANQPADDGAATPPYRNPASAS
jgi:phosphate:Na+ symporter